MKPLLPLFLLSAGLALPMRGFAQPQPSVFDLLHDANLLFHHRDMERPKTLPVNEKALTLVRQALAQPFDSVRQLSFENFDLIQDNLPNIATDFVRESQIKASQKDWPGAMNARLDALELGVKMESSARFAASAVVNADKIEAVAMREIYPLASHLDAASSRALAARLDAIETLRPTWIELLQRNRLVNLQAVEEYLQRPDWKERIVRESRVEHFTGIDPDGPSYSGIWPKELQDVSAPMLQRQVTEIWDNVFANARRPVGTKRIDLGYLPHEAAGFLFSGPESSYRSIFDMARTQALLLSSALKLKAIHQETGAYPFTFKTPADPFGSGSLIYWPIGKTYRLYSVGPDGSDDGAKTALSRFQARWPGDVIPPLLEPELSGFTP